MPKKHKAKRTSLHQTVREQTRAAITLSSALRVLLGLEFRSDIEQHFPLSVSKAIAVLITYHFPPTTVSTYLHVSPVSPHCRTSCVTVGGAQKTAVALNLALSAARTSQANALLLSGRTAVSACAR